MLEIGYESGCLKVVSNDFEQNHLKLLENAKELAEREWKYRNKENEQMPETFIEECITKKLTEYFWTVTEIPNLIWHKKNPNTEKDLSVAVLKHQLYEVECSICGKHHLIDETSLTCVKRRSCSGAKCLINTMAEKEITNTNLCKVNNNSTSLQVLNTQLVSLENIIPSLSYYGGFPQLKISYISDMHLLHHMPKGFNDENTALKYLIHQTVKSLYASMNEDGLIVFAGDTSSDAELTMQFYQAFVKYKDFIEYKEKKDVLLKVKQNYKNITNTKIAYEHRIERIKRNIENIKQEIEKYIETEKIDIYKKKYHDYDTWEETINAYKLVKSYISLNVPERCNELLNTYAQQLDTLDKLARKYLNYTYESETTRTNVGHLIDRFHKPLESITIKDLCKEHHLLSEYRKIIVILGNHEYIGFQDVQDAVEYFKPRLTELGITLLINEYIEVDNAYMIYGGTGFAKYNIEYNANKLVCCQNFTRDIEIKETTLFEEGYQKAKQLSKEKDISLVCVSHYPVKDCMSKIDSDTIYFNGHNHSNYYRRNETEIIYADNQIGYENPNIVFKNMSTGLETNPYFELNDGLYETTINDYLQFYRHIGEYIGDGTLLYQRCQNDKASIYVIKRKGYYGFFIVNPEKGISIVNGGKTKKITPSTDLQWLFDNFEVVLSKYIQVLAPLRKAQEQISKELKSLGFSGTIHGCIVDIDFYHHIMLNPLDGTMTYYYSSTFGLAQSLSTFDDVIKSIKNKDVGFLATNRDYNLLLQQFKKMKKDNCLIGKSSESYLLETSTNEEVKEQVVSRTEGMYGISRRINPLQRIFEGHVLREFDMKLVENQPKIEKNEKAQKISETLVGCSKVMNCGLSATVIEDYGYKDITIKFEDGLIREHIRRDKFKEGKVAHSKS